jgi:hypothetical protein
MEPAVLCSFSYFLTLAPTYAGAGWPTLPAKACTSLCEPGAHARDLFRLSCFFVESFGWDGSCHVAVVMVFGSFCRVVVERLQPLLRGKRGSRQMYDTKSLTKFSFGIGMENTEKIPTDTEPKYQIGIQL